MKIRKNDEVVVLSGKDRGKQGKVHSVNPDKGRVVVAGVNMIKRHTKPGRVRTQAGIIEREGPIALSNVMLVCNKCSKPTRVSFRFVENGQKVRACRHCGEIIDATK
jgi:large subunit ribosomal protein L24